MGSPFMMRMRNLFNPTQQMPQENFQPDYGPQGSTFQPSNMAMPPMAMNMAPQPQQPTMEEPSYEAEINSLMSSMYKPETAATDRLNALLSNIPQRPQQVSGLRKLGSALVGMSQGPEAQERATYAPYYRQLADFKSQFDPTLQAANLERYTNSNNRSLAYQSAQTSISARRAKVSEDAEKRRQQKAEADIDRDKKKNELARYKIDNPESDLVDDVATGNIFLVNPKTGSKIDTGLKHGDMSDLDKAKWRRGDVQARIDAKNAEDDDPENKASNWVVRNEFDRNGMPIGTVRVNKVTGTFHRVPPQSGSMSPQPPNAAGPPNPNAQNPLLTDRGFPPTQDQASMETRVGEFKNKNPKLAKWVQTDASGQPTITKPGKIAGYATGPTEQEYQQILSELYPSGNQSGMGGQFTPPTGSKPGGTWRQLPSGARVYVEP